MMNDEWERHSEHIENTATEFGVCAAKYEEEIEEFPEPGTDFEKRFVALHVEVVNHLKSIQRNVRAIAAMRSQMEDEFDSGS